MSSPADKPAIPSRGLCVAAVVGVTLLAQAVAWGVLAWAHVVRHLGYSLFDLSDTKLYFRYAAKMASGLRPFLDFRVEYPPLAIPIFALPSTAHGLASYQVTFATIMALVGVGAAVATSLTDLVGRWDRGRAYKVAVAFALLLVAVGGIIVNRYDVTVALVFAVMLLCVALGWWEVAGLVLGIGFALKLTPVFLLPLPLILAPRRRALQAFAAFVVAAIAPFVPYLLAGRGALGSLAATFTYHMQRPLEIETLLGTPLWLAHRFAGLPLTVAYTFGSHNIVAPGAKLLASASTPLVLGCLALLYWAVARRRDALRADGRLVALAMLAVLLGSMLFSKVLSPQYVVWLVPATALVAVEDAPLAIVVALAMALTQWLFPPAYTSLKTDGALGLVVLVARNAALVGAFVMAVVALKRVPAGSPANRD